MAGLRTISRPAGVPASVGYSRDSNNHGLRSTAFHATLRQDWPRAEAGRDVLLGARGPGRTGSAPGLFGRGLGRPRRRGARVVEVTCAQPRLQENALGAQ